MVLGASDYNPPLLPFEKQIIELTGCSEDEYRRLVADAIRRSGPRPAGYEHIPDVRMDPLTISIISLVVGVAASAASYLLTPKPKAPSDSRGVRQRSLASVNGASRFNPTFGFDTQAELADYGDPIPIIFGRSTSTTGGIVVSPSLVWSRMFSYGNQQGVKLLMVVGEQGYDGGQDAPGIAAPVLEGIFLGNGSLSSVYNNLFAFYWKQNTTRSGYTRIKARNLFYGTRGGRDTGDPETADDIFSCPTRVSDNDYGFSSAHTPTNNAEFGCYDPIPNGTAYRVNWRVISIVRLEGQEDDPGNNLLFERIKISGDQDQKASNVQALGMDGTGRNYSRRMGVTQLNGIPVSGANLAEERTVNINDTIQFTISSEKIRRDIYSRGKVKVDDINSEVAEQCYAADEAMQVGELFMIGRSVWQVNSRRLNTWKENGPDQTIQLKCIEVPPNGYDKIGLVSSSVLTKNYISDDTTAPNGIFPGIAFYPLMKFAVATVRNTRACDVTEIGLRSLVYQRLNGLCNFQSLPEPAELVRAERNRINLTSGTMNGYIRRSSSFTIFVRPAGLDASGQPFPWVHIGGRFTVVGNQPREAYNYIRVKHPDRRQYEFKIIPKNGADMRLTPDSSSFWVLNASGATSEQLSESFSTNYGVFELRSSGYRAFRYDLSSNKEMKGKNGSSITTTVQSFPSSAGISTYLPLEMQPVSKATSIYWLVNWSNPEVTLGRSHAFAWEVFGGAGDSPLPLGGVITKQVREYDEYGRWMDIRYTARKSLLPAGHYANRIYTWVFELIEVLQSSSGWYINDQIILKRTLNSGNPYRTVPNEGTMNQAGVIMVVGAAATESGLQGRTQAWLEHLLGPARFLGVGTKRTYYLDLTKGAKRIRLAIDTFVENVIGHWSGISSLWAMPTISVVQNETYTTKDWSQFETIDSTVNVSPSNAFWKSSLPVGAQFQINSVSQETIVVTQSEDERVFEGQSQYADLSFYGDLVEKSNKSNPEHSVVYVNEIVENTTPPTYANMTICGLALKASRNFTSLDQLRLWLSSGIHVRRWHPDDAATPVGPSNLLTDLIYYLLTDTVAGVGDSLGMNASNPVLIDTESLATTALFLKANSLFYDGVIDGSVNLRQFISDIAPSFLCNFVVKDGKFGLTPALPATKAGQISRDPVQIKQLFTAGNIIEDSFEVEYLPAEERKDFQAIVRYREQRPNQMPQERNVAIRWADSSEYTPVESFDLTGYCTSRAHAALVARFFLSVRKRVTHTIRFATTPYGIGLAPGDYIKVVTQSSPYSAANNGTVNEAGDIISATALADGQYRVIYYKVGDADINEGTLTVSNGKSSDTALRNIVFTVLQSNTSENVYMVEQLTLSEDNTVQITASEFPCDSKLSSLIAQDVLDFARFQSES